MRLFNKDFYKFFFSFVGIVSAVLLLVLVIGTHLA